jgi:hypothetical protein
MHLPLAESVKSLDEIKPSRHADSGEDARLKRDDCAQGVLDDAAPRNGMIPPGARRALLAE